MGDCQTMAVNTRNRIHAVLAVAGLEPDEADELVCALEAGAVAGAHCWVEELPGCAPGARGAECAEGWGGAVHRSLGVLVSTADNVYRQRGHAHVTRSLFIGGEILHNRLAREGPAAEAGPAPFDGEEARGAVLPDLPLSQQDA
ncbi:hypothetical protein [Streptomyces sp. NPDC056982]|uniref:hypothetical protein n=1 Tax=Streptomyces sp. NPDC056982 TaxID=3345986 RepID=UPI00363CFA31